MSNRKKKVVWIQSKGYRLEVFCRIDMFLKHEAADLVNANEVFCPGAWDLGWVSQRTVLNESA